MQTIEFYFDPSCPWCWVTSRWLSEVATQRDISIEWKPFSLAIKNDEIYGDDSTGHQEPHMKAHKLMRIMEAVHAAKGIDRGELYTAFTKAYYLDKDLHDDALAAAVLEQLGVDADYIKAGDDGSYDKSLEAFMDEAIAIVGNDVGVPLIVFVNDEGEKQGYFGPVLQGLPDTQEGLKLWDGIQHLATSKHFFELKRSRTGGAIPRSTERLFQTGPSK